MFFDFMRANDRNEWAYRVANQRSYPGWGHMLERGATTLWESWRYPDNGPSQNHPMFGSIGEWFYRSLLGINPGAPGFETVVVKPQPAGDLTWARGAYRSIRGLITSEWRREGDEFQLRVNIPPNTKAEIWLLAGQQATTLESGKLLSATPGIAEYKRDGRYLVISCGSGNYTFSSKLN
jgi:alpha-L-rhamnosidase